MLSVSVFAMVSFCCLRVCRGELLTAHIRDLLTVLAYNDDPFVNAIKFGLPMLLMLSFLFTAINIVRVRRKLSAL